LPAASHRHTCLDPFDTIRLAPGGVDIGMDHARAHRIDPDAFAGDLFGQAQGHAVDGALGGRVVDVFAWCAEAGGHRRQVDDGAAPAAMARRHPLDRLACAQEAADHVGAQYAGPARRIHLFQAHLLLKHAGVVDQHVQPAELPVDGFEHVQHLGLVSDVGLYGDRRYAQAADLLEHRVRGIRALVIVQAQGIALLRRQSCSGGADAAAGACDQHDSGHVLPLVAWLVCGLLKSVFRYLSTAQRDAEVGSRPFQLADFRRFIMSSFPMAPLFRQSVGFDRFNDLFESALRNDTGSSYPPYNIEKHGDDQYRIVVAAAGFQESDLDLQVERSVLTITGGRRENEAENVTYLHQGIAQRAFKLSFRLADHIEVKGAALNSGLLHIDLVRVVPEEAKPKRIPINADQRPALEG